MEKSKKGIQIELCSEADSGYTSVGLSFAMLGTTFMSIDGFPFVITMLFFLLGIILPAYELVTKVADKPDTDGQGDQEESV